jgi:hypothetical protein
MPTREIQIGRGQSYLLLADPEIGRDGVSRTVQTTLVLPGLRAEVRVWLGEDEEARPTPDGGLSAFFGNLAQEWRGWDGVERWSAYSEGLRLEATMTRQGHVTLHVVLQRSTGEWTIEGDVLLDAGQLAGVADEVAALCGDDPIDS